MRLEKAHSILIIALNTFRTLNRSLQTKLVRKKNEFKKKPPTNHKTGALFSMVVEGRGPRGPPCPVNTPLFPCTTGGEWGINNTNERHRTRVLH